MRAMTDRSICVILVCQCAIITLLWPATCTGGKLEGSIIHMKIKEDDMFTDGLKDLKTQDVSFSFAKHFQDNMVLQRAPQRANIYGFSPYIGQKIVIELREESSLKEQYHVTKVKPGPSKSVGVWSVTLDPVEANVTASITVTSEQNSLSLHDVIFGDVWVCSGQSNMQFVVSMMAGAEEELANAHKYPNIRLLAVADNVSTTPLYDFVELLKGWSKPSNETIGGKEWTYFSAVCWLYGKTIHLKTGYPIGLIDTSWGGTPVEAWSSKEALKKCQVNTTATDVMHFPSDGYPATMGGNEMHDLGLFGGPQNISLLWNAMIHPLLRMTIYGAIWYQGEADSYDMKRVDRYNCTFPTMIDDWREKFHEASVGQTSKLFPFGFVQLSAKYKNPVLSRGFPEIRWHQTADYGYVPNARMPNVFMAVAMDLPGFNSKYGAVHPLDKKDVGFRLSLCGLNIAYNHTNVCQGPLPTNGVVQNTTIILTYGSTDKILVKDYIGFEVLCGDDWIPTSIIDNGMKTVTIFSGFCSQPISGLRYAWRQSPCSFKKCAVYETHNGLPGPPFVASVVKGTRGQPSYLDFTRPTHI